MTDSRSPTYLITGGSSFTGWAFISRATAAGAHVVAPLARRAGEYQGVRTRRVDDLLANPRVTVVPAAPMGSQTLLACLRHQPRIDAVGIHHAVVGDWRSPTFDVGAAVTSSTLGAQDFLAAATAAGARGLVLTHSVFESDAGRGSDPRAIGLYGVAKRASGEVWAELSRRHGLPVQHFTITNPVGPMEEPRLIAHLVRHWQRGQVPTLKSPHYVRDNVASPVLASAYLASLEAATDGVAGAHTPSMWIETNLQFAQRVAGEFGARWHRRYEVGVEPEVSDDEPVERVGLDPVHFADPAAATRFWDAYARHYST